MNENKKEEFWTITYADRKPTFFEVIDVIFMITSTIIGTYVVTKALLRGLFILIWGVKEATEKIKEDKEKEETEEETDN